MHSKAAEQKTSFIKKVWVFKRIDKDNGDRFCAGGIVEDPHKSAIAILRIFEFIEFFMQESAI